ncbi:hypothetical protein AHAS_Ahas09G0283500 [Arachis hypogaea]
MHKRSVVVVVETDTCMAVVVEMSTCKASCRAVEESGKPGEECREQGEPVEVETGTYKAVEESGKLGEECKEQGEQVVVEMGTYKEVEESDTLGEGVRGGPEVEEMGTCKASLVVAESGTLGEDEGVDMGEGEGVGVGGDEDEGVGEGGKCEPVVVVMSTCRVSLVVVEEMSNGMAAAAVMSTCRASLVEEVENGSSKAS